MCPPRSVSRAVSRCRMASRPRYSSPATHHKVVEGTYPGRRGLAGLVPQVAGVGLEAPRVLPVQAEVPDLPAEHGVVGRRAAPLGPELLHRGDEREPDTGRRQAEAGHAFTHTWCQAGCAAESRPAWRPGRVTAVPSRGAPRPGGPVVAARWGDAGPPGAPGRRAGPPAR